MSSRRCRVSASAPSGYDRSNPLRIKLREKIRRETQALLDRPVERCRPNCYTDADYLDAYLRHVEWRNRPADLAAPIAFSGVALGVDIDACGVWLRMRLPYVALVPFDGQELRWPREPQAVYSEVLRRAAGVYVCHDGRPTSDAHAGELLKKRDEVLCCVADELIAVWDGSRGGTSYTVRKWDGFGGGPGRLHRIDPREFR